MSVPFRTALGTVVDWATRQRTDGVYVQQVEVITAVPAVVDWQELTVGTAQGTLASFCEGGALPSGATHALFKVAKTAPGSIVWNDGGDAPTAAYGWEAGPGEWGEMVALSTVRLIATANGTKIGVSFRRY